MSNLPMNLPLEELCSNIPINDVAIYLKGTR